jgi:hypothetical protein
MARRTPDRVVNYGAHRRALRVAAAHLLRAAGWPRDDIALVLGCSTSYLSHVWSPRPWGKGKAAKTAPAADPQADAPAVNPAGEAP